MPCQPNRLMIDSLHQATIASNNPSAVINQRIAKNGVQMPLGNRHTNRSCKPLPQWAGCRFYAFKLKILRMPCAWAVQLAKIANVVDGRPRITTQMERCISEH